MSTAEIANQLVNYCRQGQYEQAQKELYHPNAVSIEPKGAPVEVIEGIEGIIGKGKQFAEMVDEVHSIEVSDPILSDDFFSISMTNEVTFKGIGRQRISEICVYEVKDGKIVKEQFFYTPTPMG